MNYFKTLLILYKINIIIISSSISIIVIVAVF